MPKTVLIVEDNDLNMKLFNDLLEAHGYGTLQARDGFGVLSQTREHRPDLILMDVQLPDMSGLEVARLLKQDNEVRHIPVVAVTAFAMKGDEQSVRDAGCDGYLSKPISITGFLEMVRQYIG